MSRRKGERPIARPLDRWSLSHPVAHMIATGDCWFAAWSMQNATPIGRLAKLTGIPLAADRSEWSVAMTDGNDPMAGQPVYRWQEIANYTPGRLALFSDGVTKKLGYGENGAWFEMVDGEEYELTGFEPTEWCDPPNGFSAWG